MVPRRYRAASRIAPRGGNRHNVSSSSGRQRPGIAVSPVRRFARTSRVTEAIMSDAFQDRENTFEKQFAHDEDLRFKAVARRNKAVALWVAETKGLFGADAEAYASEFVGAQVGKSDDDVAAALKADLARRRRRPLRSPAAQEDGRGDGSRRSPRSEPASKGRTPQLPVGDARAARTRPRRPGRPRA